MRKMTATVLPADTKFWSMLRAHGRSRKAVITSISSSRIVVNECVFSGAKSFLRQGEISDLYILCGRAEEVGESNISIFAHDTMQLVPPSQPSLYRF